MLIKTICYKCGDILNLYVHDENRKKATNSKRYIKGKFCCQMIDRKCNEKENEEYGR